ncbi:MAG: hypothetical protein ACKVP0_02395 [Pirellulaceae bacterium]
MSQGNYGGYTPPNPNNPYANTGSFGQAPPPKKSKAWIWILGIVGGGGILVCGCCGGLTYFAYNTGMTMIAEQTKQEIQGKPVVQEHIGTIESASPDLMAGVEETQKKGAKPGESHLVIHIKGSKGSGDVIGRMPQGGGQRLTEKVLRLPDGKEHSLE